jgi:hypothetical protein
MEKGVGFVNAGGDLGSNSAGWKSVLDGDESIGLLNALYDGLSVQGLDSS